MNCKGIDGLLRNSPYQIHVCVGVYVFQWFSLMLSMLFCIHLLLPMDSGKHIASPVFVLAYCMYRIWLWLFSDVIKT